MDDNKKSKIQLPAWGWLIISFLAALALWFFLLRRRRDEE